jgi:hypothetical protein
MNLFESTFEKHKKLMLEHLGEAIVDVPSKKLSDIFDDNGKMKKEVVNTIHRGIKEIQTAFPKLEITDYFVVGAAVTYQYTDESDIDTTVVVSKDLDKDLFKKVDKWIEHNLDPKYKYGKRPYQFKINANGRENKNADAAYDVKKQEWIKAPDAERTSADYEKVVNDPNSYERKIYMSVERSIQPSLQRLDQQIKKDNSLTNAVKELMQSAYKKYEIIKNFRGKSYGSDKRTDSRISQNWGVGNVIYKFLDREGYINVFSEIKRAIKSNYDVDLKELSSKLNKVVNDEIGYALEENKNAEDKK